MQIERENWEAWLTNQPDSREFIYMCNMCVVGSFLAETTGHKEGDFAITPTGFYLKAVSGFDIHYPLPDWLRKDKGGVLTVEPLTAGNMKKRYLELFPDTDLSPITDSGTAGVPMESSKGDRTTVIGG